MLCIKSIETEEVKLMLGVSLIIIAAAIVYMVETYISTYYTIEYMHGTSLFLILLAKYGTPVLFLLLCAYIAYRNFLKKQKAAASAASERPTSKEELYTNKIQTALTPPTIEIVGFLGGSCKAHHHAACQAASYAVSHKKPRAWLSVSIQPLQVDQHTCLCSQLFECILL